MSKDTRTASCEDFILQAASVFDKIALLGAISLVLSDIPTNDVPLSLLQEQSGYAIQKISMVKK